MASQALRLIPAGAKHVGGNTYQLPSRRRHAGAMVRHKKGGGKFGPRRKHSLFAKQWVWYAVALALADALGTVVFASGVAPWVSVPALFLFAYGTWKKKPGAINAALAIQAAHLLAYWGVNDMIRGLAEKARGAGGGS